MKKLLALILSVAVVASIAAAGTLAYLNAGTGVVENTFTVGTEAGGGTISGYIDETDIDSESGERTTEGNHYTDVFPGSTLVKDPTVHIDDDSESCWLFVGVRNDQPEKLEIQNLSSDMEEVGAVNGYTVYLVKTVQNAGDEFLVFDGVKVPAALDNEGVKDINTSLITPKRLAGLALRTAKALLWRISIDSKLCPSQSNPTLYI